MSVERIERIASQLLGDLDAVDGIYQDRAAQSQQKLQLILDAFEQVGVVALDHVPSGYTERDGFLYPKTLDAR